MWSAPAALALWNGAQAAVEAWGSSKRVPAGTESGRGLPQSKTLREVLGQRSPPGCGVRQQRWRFGTGHRPRWKREVRRSASRRVPKAVGDYRSPRRYFNRQTIRALFRS